MSFDQKKAVLKRRVESGTEFVCLATDTHALSKVVEGAYGRLYNDIVEEKLWTEIALLTFFNTARVIDAQDRHPGEHEFPGTLHMMSFQEMLLPKGIQRWIPYPIRARHHRSPGSWAGR